MRESLIFWTAALCIVAADDLVRAATVTGRPARVLISSPTTTNPVTRQLLLRPPFRPNRGGGRIRPPRSVDGSIVIAEPNAATNYVIHKVRPVPGLDHCIEIVDPTGRKY